MRVMAIDYGDARTGIAISDALGMLTGTTTVIHSWNPEKTAQEIARLTRENGVERIVLGLPKNMDGTEGPRAELFTVRLPRRSRRRRAWSRCSGTSGGRPSRRTRS